MLGRAVVSGSWLTSGWWLVTNKQCSMQGLLVGVRLFFSCWVQKLDQQWVCSPHHVHRMGVASVSLAVQCTQDGDCGVLSMALLKTDARPVRHFLFATCCGVVIHAGMLCMYSSECCAGGSQNNCPVGGRQQLCTLPYTKPTLYLAAGAYHPMPLGFLHAATSVLCFFGVSSCIMDAACVWCVRCVCWMQCKVCLFCMAMASKHSSGCSIRCKHSVSATTGLSRNRPHTGHSPTPQSYTVFDCEALQQQLQAVVLCDYGPQQSAQ